MKEKRLEKQPLLSSFEELELGERLRCTGIVGIQTYQLLCMSIGLTSKSRVLLGRAPRVSSKVPAIPCFGKKEVLTCWSLPSFLKRRGFFLGMIKIPILDRVFSQLQVYLD